MKSMTGFGHGVAADANGTSVTVEISAVNSRKQLELRLSLPKELISLDMPLRSLIQKRLARGTLNVSVTYQRSEQVDPNEMPLDWNAARAFLAALEKFAEEHQLQKPTLQELLLIPGVMKLNDNTVATLRPLVMQALEAALAELEQMRQKEGEALKQELALRRDNIKTLVYKIADYEQEAICQMKQRIMERIAQLGVELPVDDERLAKEVAFYVDKSDITEEVVRLKSHLQQFESFLNASSEIGRNLDFLCQEMCREANTLSAKCCDMVISEDALALKIELSKVKEQIMNVE